VSLFACQWLVACGQTVEVGVDDALVGAGKSTSGASGASGTSGAGGTLQIGGNLAMSTAGESAAEAGAAACVPTLCRGKVYQCGNCVDDDQDGQLDGLDADCLGPCDDDEHALSTGLKVSGGPACKQDCYFDGDSGSGNDKCEWSHACDPLSLAPDYPPSADPRCAYTGKSVMGVDCSALAVAQDSKCLEACLPLVPNGCDCFGCCELPGGSGDFRFVGGACDLDSLDDRSLCPVCTPVKDACFNACDKCEVCIGHAPDPSCQADAGDGCKDGQRACDAKSPCDFGDYCVTGCCVRAPEPT